MDVLFQGYIEIEKVTVLSPVGDTSGLFCGSGGDDMTDPIHVCTTKLKVTR